MTNALSKQVDAAARKLALQRVRLEKLVAREHEANVARYRAAAAKANAKAKASTKAKAGAKAKPVAAALGLKAAGALAAAKTTAPTFVAEGDSWFRYVVGFAVIWHLEKKLGTQILNLATPGDETSDMLSGGQRDRIRCALVQGPALKRKFDYLLFSGGGNDLVGNDRLENLLFDFVPGMSAAKVINKAAVDAALAAIEKNYRALIALRDKHSPATKIILHAYDFPLPSNAKVCGRGPWLRPSLVKRGVPAALQPDVMKLLMLRLKASLEGVVAGTKNVSIVETQGTLSAQHWENELHPTKAGFGLIADRYVAHLQNGGPSPKVGIAAAKPKIAKASAKVKAKAVTKAKARTKGKAKPKP